MIAFLFLVAAAAVAAQTTPLIQNTGARQGVTLNGAWQSIIDPYEVGYLDYRYEPLKDGGFGADKKPKDESDRVEYDFDKSPLLQVPGDWNTQRPELMFYEGTIWYRRKFDYSLAAGHRLFVYFGAANYRTVVFLNGKKLGEHTGGFTAFNFEITPLVKREGNSLVVKVDNQRKLEAVPTVNTDWWNYGGLTRDVQLVDVPETFVRDYFVQLAKGSSSRVSGWVQLDGARMSQTVRIRIPEASAETTAQTDANGKASFAFDAKLILWSPENPKLYEVRVEADSDRLLDTIGFRTLETRGYDILVNGKPVFLRGITMHAEAPYRTGRAFSDDDARTLLGWAQELHCNFVRLAHYPHDERMEKLADRLGILVWSEIPVYWTIQWENRATYANAETQLTEMISRDKNRASVMLWSVANETPVSEPRMKFLGNLVAKTRELDPTRLVTAALERHYVNETVQMINDPLGKLLDVIGCNEYIGWYDGPPEKADKVQWEMVYEKPLVISEFGGGAQQGRHASDRTVWSEEYQRSIYEHQVAMFERISFLRGATPWVLMDFRSPRRPLAGIQDYFNRKGLISERGQKKAAFFVMQRWYEQRQKQESRPVK